MDSIWDFIRAASPWVAMGLLLMNGTLYFTAIGEKK